MRVGGFESQEAPAPGRRWSWRGLVAALLATGALVGVVGLVGAFVVDDVLDRWNYGTGACNDVDGNAYIEDVLIDKLPSGTLRSYLNTGSDCDDRNTGSVAAAWTTGLRPASVVDQMTKAGWARTVQAGGAPEWYATNAVASDPSGTCLSPSAGVWQAPGRAEYPSPGCSGPEGDQVILTRTNGSRSFVARLGAAGLAVDAAHEKDGDAAARILLQQERDPYK